MASDLNGIDSLLSLMGQLNASTLHLTVGMPPVYRIGGELKQLPDVAGLIPDAAGIVSRMSVALKPESINLLANQILVSARHKASLAEVGSVDLARSIPGTGRFRINVYNQRGSLAVVCHALMDKIPCLDEYFPDDGIKALLNLSMGLVLVIGPANSGKTTLLAAMINYVNKNHNRHILVIEDSIEYLHPHQKSLVNQRQIGDDVRSYNDGLEVAVSQDPDMIVVGNVPDSEVMMRAIAAAEGGRLVIAAMRASTFDEAMGRFILNGDKMVNLASIMIGKVILDARKSLKVSLPVQSDQHGE